MNHNKVKKLLAKYFFGEINSVEKELLNSWLEKSPKHQELFDRLKNDTLLKERYDVYAEINSQKAWKYFKKTCLSRRNIYLSIVKYAAILFSPVIIAALGWYYHDYFLPQQESMYNIAASVDSIHPGISQAVLSLPHQKITVLKSSGKIQAGNGMVSKAVIRGGTLIYPQNHDGAADNKSHENETEENHTLATNQGNEFRVMFEDGTEVHLNYDSKLTYPVKFNSKQRVVYLDGEAYFKIAKDSRPFYVITENGTVKQYGTEFNVNTFTSGRTEVVLVRGNISVIPKNGQSERRLLPGQLAYTGINGNVSIHNVDVTPYVAWNEGRLVFENKSLEYIMTILERWYGVEVEFEYPELKNLHFTGDMDRYGTISPFLNAIERATNLKINIQGKKIVVTTN